MSAALFVSNGHGEASIADRIAADVGALLPALRIDHLALVGTAEAQAMNGVGPVRAMPSGGLIAMGNVRNLARDVAAGLLGLTLAQLRFLRSARDAYAVAIAVGDTYALALTLVARAPTIFVGTAKSVSVAPYGPIEERIIRRAAACFVRDEATAQRLASRGVRVEPAANVIVDLFGDDPEPAAWRCLRGFDPALVLLPGSREAAYADAAMLLDVARDLAAERPTLGAALSVARSLDGQRLARDAATAGWSVVPLDDVAMPFELVLDGRARVRAWTGALGPVLRHASIVLGQAGTANEAAAAAGVPVVAFDAGRGGKIAWYRRRQRGLLGDALVVLPARTRAAVEGVNALLDDPSRRRAMGEAGRARMGGPGGAARIAARIAAIVTETARA